jgi:hypothetical protein
MRRLGVELGRIRRGKPHEAEFKFFDEHLLLVVRLELTSYGRLSNGNEGRKRSTGPKVPEPPQP